MAGWSRVRILTGAINFSRNIRPALEPNQSPVQLVSGEISPGWGWGDWLWHDIDHSLCLALKLWIGGALPLLPPPGHNIMDRDNFTINACFVNCVRTLTPKDYGVLLKFYDFVHLSSKPLACKLKRWNLDFTFLRGPIEMNVKSRKM
jgi:hypothetical protein